MGNICLSCTNFDDTDVYNRDGEEIDAIVTSIYDGDTITVGIIENCKKRKYNLRMYGYDSPELKPSLSIPNRDLHIQAANICKKYLSNIILGKKVTIRLYKNEKFGRLLGEVYYRGHNINNLMVSRCFCKPYLGKKKEDFTYEDLKKIININV